MKTMSFNILCRGTGRQTWMNRIPLVVRTIRNWNPDTFGVQEAHWSWMQALIGCFPDYAYVGIGRDDGVRDGEFAAIFYKTDRYEPVDQGSFWLSETPELPGSFGWDAACVRICSWVRLRSKTDGSEFVHMNTHLDHVGKVAMKNGAALICERANAFPPSLPIILTGDFNCTPDSEPIEAIRCSGFRDIRDMLEKSDYAPTFHGFQEDPHSHILIDYIFCKGSITAECLRVIRDEIDGQIPSDHYPVAAEISF